MSKFELVPTSKGKQYLFFEKQFFYKLKPTDQNGITIWRCRLYYDKDIRCKILLRSNNEGEVVSLNGQHDHFEKDVNIVEPLMKNVVQQIKEKLNSARAPLKKTFEQTLNN
ncbi:unnamed protein product [Brachionus calyciflorus]|uniref:FLYWCH-type domain-containing protein n=1 Tax=Brachionus calyciflorus TaxID=104777 RepID=A0A814I682_9BILA|nr:unnamed protein product [Brachionus calyciflorus]